MWSSYWGPVYAYQSSSYLYDANGNMTKRGSRTLVWNHENHLSQSKVGSTVEESYLYDDSGQRVKKWNSTSAVYCPNAFYEVETGTGSIVASQVEDFALDESSSDAVALNANPIYLPLVAQGGTVAGLQSDGGDVSAASLATNVVKYYYFGGQRVAMSDGGSWYYLHGDHLGGTALTTKTDGTAQTHQNYYVYGRKRGGGALPTDRQYTGQQKDKTGLYYYNARYYDLALGQFVSPDTIVPDPTSVLSYNRFLYTQANPLNRVDPDGHQDIDGGSCAPTDCPSFSSPSQIDIIDAEPPWGPSQSPNDNWLDLGFDWLLENGPEPRTFGGHTHMVDNLKDHPGVLAAKEQFQGQYTAIGQSVNYPHDFGVSGYLNAWVELDGTGHFLGSYNVEITRLEDDSANVTITNLSGRQSFTNLRVGRGTLGEQVDNLVNGRDVNFPRHILANRQREDSWWGGNLNQIYTWEESISGWLPSE